MFAHLMTPVKVEGFAGGDGTEKNPYQIKNVKQFNMIRKYLDQNFILIKDINLKKIKNFKPIGNEDSPFEGIFDGNKKTIKNLRIDRSDEDYVGLFGVITQNSVLKNIKLRNINVEGEDNVGGLIGWNAGQVINIDIKGKVEGEDYVGGISGYNGNVKNSRINVSVIGWNNIGGIVGYLSRGSIKNSYVMGKVKGISKVGGLVGYFDRSYIESCYSLAKITGQFSDGALIGWIERLSFIRPYSFKNNTYWVSGSSPKKVGTQNESYVNSIHMIKKTKKQMKNLTYRVTGWDKDIWVFEKGKYPRLFWEK